MSLLRTDTQTAAFIELLAKRCQARIFKYQNKKVPFAEFKDDFFTAFIEQGIDVTLIENCEFYETAQYPSITVANDPETIEAFMNLVTIEDIAAKYNALIVVIEPGELSPSSAA